MASSWTSRVSIALEKIHCWSTPKPAIHRGRKCPFLLSSRLLGGPVPEGKDLALRVDPDLREFWSVANSADLFKDEKFGQWGLRIFSPEEARNETERQLSRRPNDYFGSDLVVGRFYGDSDLLVERLRKVEEGTFEFVVATPLDPRKEWKFVASSFADFLERFLAAEGDKYWEFSK